MLDRLNAAMVEIQGALLARGLYPEGHPRILRGEQEALRILEELLAERERIDLFALDSRVVFDSAVLPSSSNLNESLFRELRLVGIDQLSFKRGLQLDELQAFLDALAGGGARDERRIRSSSHLGFGSLQGRAERPVDDRDLAGTDEVASTLADVWDEVEQHQRIDTGVLSDIVSSLSQVVSDSYGAMLPLAPLKQHDEYTFIHTINVALLATALAEAVGFDGESVHELSVAALLHDVGKRAIPKEIINKAGRFTDDEARLMQRHPVEGARILLNTPQVPEIAAIVAFEHHVRMDGSGYPRLPRDWRLSLGSRIVQIADVFDALRTDRPYRSGQPVSKIVEIMTNDVGTFFDADLLSIFLHAVVSRGVPAVERSRVLAPEATG